MPKLFENESIENGKLHICESFSVKPIISESEKVKELKKITEAKDDSKKFILKPKIAAIHEGRTRNNTIYLEEKLRGSMVTEGGPSGMYSFLYPYNKPMLKNHDRDSEPTGRVMNTQYIKGAEGSGYVMIIPHITDPDTIEKILDGRYLTVSIGATTDSAICNICGQDIIKDGWCEHERGEIYDGNKCGWIIGEVWFDECSWVNVPSDAKAKVIDPSNLEVYAEVNNENFDLTNDLPVNESVSEDLGLVAVVAEEYKEPGQESEKEEDLTDDEEADKEEETEEMETLEDPEEEVTDSIGQDQKTEDDSSQKEENIEQKEEGSISEKNEKDKGNAPNQIEVDLLNERIIKLENEVEILNEKIEIQKKEYNDLSQKFSNFIKEAIKESQKNIEIEGLKEEELSNFDIEELMNEYRKISEIAKKKISDLSQYKITNTYQSNNEESEEKPETRITRVQIYQDLLRGKRK